MEQALAAIHQANSGRVPLELLFARHARTVALFCRVPLGLLAAVSAQLAAHYPTATVARLPDSALVPPGDSSCWSAELRLTPDLFPIRRYPQFDDLLNRNASDPLTAIFASLTADPDGRTAPSIVLTVRPAAARRVRATRRALQRLSRPFFRSHPHLTHLYAVGCTSRSAFLRILTRLFGALCGRPADFAMPVHLTTTPARAHDREEDLQAASDKLARHLFEVHVQLLVHAPPAAARRARSLLTQMAGAFGQFTLPRMARFRLSRIRARPPQPLSRGFLLSCEELATLWHLPTTTVRAPAMQIVESRELEPPTSLPSPLREPDTVALGRVKFRSRSDLFGLRLDDRRRHLAVIGKTGMGKTTLLQGLIASNMQANRGLALLDPHGDLADAILDAVPRHRTNDVIVFDAGDRDYPLSFNVLACREAYQRGLVASAVVSAFKKLYGESWGPRLEYILRNALLALLETPGTSLLSLQRLLSDSGYRKTITARLHDPVVRAFWEREFASWKPQYQAEALAPILNKVGQFLSIPTLRAIVGQGRTSLNLRSVMDEGKLLVVNLSKGRIGDDASSLLGSLLVTAIQLAAMSRAEIAEKERRDFTLYVDEFQQFATDSFATILSEARKYRLSLVLANQYLAQMDEATADAIFGNVGSLLAFQVGARDAEVLSEQLGRDVTPQDLLALPRFRAYARLLVDGMPSRPFSLETLAPRASERGGRSAIIRRTSRHRYSRPAALVEEEIRHVLTSQL
jgi:hypothetical protein